MKKIYLIVIFLILGIDKNYSQGWQWKDSTMDSKILKDANDDLYVFSNDTAGFTIKKLDGNGATLWTKTAVGKAEITAYKTDGGNNLVLLGNLTSSTAINTFTLIPKGQQSFFILKISSNSSVLSANVYGSPSKTFANDLFINANGEYLIGGGFIGTFDMNGYSVIGDTLQNFFIVKTDNNQNVLWSEKSTLYTSSGEAWLDEVVETASGKIYATVTFLYGLVEYNGYQFTSSDGQFLIQLDNSRNITWTSYIDYPPINYDYMSDIQTNGDTVYMKDYAHSNHDSWSSIYMWNDSGIKTSTYYSSADKLAYTISNGKIYYAFITPNAPYGVTFYYRKIGSLTLGLSDQSQTADSAVTIHGSYSEIQYINPTSLYIGGGGEGMNTPFVGKFNMSATTVVANAESNQFQIFPNPSSGKLVINKETKLTSFKVYNSIGCPVNYIRHGNEIDLSGQPQGIYFVEMLTEGKRTVKKIILE